MNKRFSSKAHDICAKQLKNRENDETTKFVDAMNQKHIGSICELFNEVCSLAKRNRPFSDFEDGKKL